MRGLRKILAHQRVLQIARFFIQQHEDGQTIFRVLRRILVEALELVENGLLTLERITDGQVFNPACGRLDVGQRIIVPFTKRREAGELRIRIYRPVSSWCQAIWRIRVHFTVAISKFCTRLLSQLALHPGLDRCQRSRQLARLVAACHRQVGLAAALATYLGGNEIHQFAGLDFAGDIRRHRGDQADLAVRHGAQHQRAGFQLVAQLVGGFAQALGIDAVELRRQYAHAF